MIYKTIVYFTDLQDKGHPYHVGDPFPREGMKVSAERILELSGNKNKRGIPLIEKVPEKKKPVKTIKKTQKEG